MLRRFREVIEKEIGEAEEEVAGLGEEAVGMMKEIEKVSLGEERCRVWDGRANGLQDFRKATLPDLHTFFQSIDEP